MASTAMIAALWDRALPHLSQSTAEVDEDVKFSNLNTGPQTNAFKLSSMSCYHQSYHTTNGWISCPGTTCTLKKCIELFLHCFVIPSRKVEWCSSCRSSAIYLFKGVAEENGSKYCFVVLIFIYLFTVAERWQDKQTQASRYCLTVFFAPTKDAS